LAPIAEGDAVEPAKIGRQGCAPGLRRADGISGSHRAPTYDEPRNSLFDSDEPVMHQIIDAVAPGDALDAACGTGRYAEYLAGRGHRVVGVDSSPDMLARARARAPSPRSQPGCRSDAAKNPADQTTTCHRHHRSPPT
jgi:SAM-dependent methyltransferase